jgi:hypothetical protein
MLPQVLEPFQHPASPFPEKKDQQYGEKLQPEH